MRHFVEQYVAGRPAGLGWMRLRQMGQYRVTGDPCAFVTTNVSFLRPKRKGLMAQIDDYRLRDLLSLESWWKWTWRGLLLLIAVIIIGMWGCPKYKVYEQNLTGAAELARAEQNRQIQIAVSKAKFEAAQFEAAADTMRAHGIARSNAIIGEKLAGEIGERYLRYLWIQGIGEKDHVIYVPTEAGLPILEAGKRTGGKP